MRRGISEGNAWMLVLGARILCLFTVVALVVLALKLSMPATWRRQAEQALPPSKASDEVKQARKAAELATIGLRQAVQQERDRA
jgi:hypothetical protein